MGSTFISLANKVLRKINEVEVTETQFPSTRGMQSVAKDAVLDSISEINQQKWHWPWHSTQVTKTLIIGQNEYLWEDDFQSVDWESFQLLKDEVLNTKSTHLPVVNREEWYARLRDRDSDSLPDGIEHPKCVFRSHNHGFGVSPTPDKEYQISYRYYKQPLVLDMYDDECDIPSVYDNIIVWGALVHMNLFRENAEGNQIAEAKFQQGIKNMYTLLVGSNHENLVDTRVNFGGYSHNQGTENYK